MWWKKYLNGRIDEEAMKVFWILIVAVLLSGCTLGGGGTSSGGDLDLPDEVTSGNGLDIKVSFDDEWIDIRQVTYEIEFSNSGKHPVVITRENLELLTTEVISGGRTVFTEKTVNDFYESIFRGENQIRLINGQRHEAQGTLIISREFFNNLNQEDFEYEIYISYDYQTDFSTNVELDLENKRLSTGSLSQAAPIKVTDVELRPRVGDEYDAIYTVEDRGKEGIPEGARIIIDNWELNFGSTSLGCEIFVEEEGVKKRLEGDIAITKEQDEIIFVCRIDTGRYLDNEVTNTVTSGIFEYEYTIIEEGTIRLPTQRNSEFS